MIKSKNAESVRPSLSEKDDAISRSLVAARLGARALPGFPGDVPQNLEQAYAIQSASIARWPDEVAGWKIGMLPPADRDRYSAERLAGPIFRSQVNTIEPGSARTAPIFCGGFAAVEAEFVLALATEVQPTGEKYSDDDLVAIVAALHVGIEIASSPMADINRLGPAVVISDFGNNAGVFPGPKVPNWNSCPLDSLTAKVTVDDVVVGDASAAAIPGGPLGALRFLIGLSAKRGIVLPAGTLISTGASTGIHEVDTSSASRIDFGAHGLFDLTFEPMTPWPGLTEPANASLGDL